MLPYCEKLRTMITLCPSYPYATILSFTARIERAHSDRARSASKKDGWLLTSYLSSPVPLRGWLHAF